jgi:hypothetical protein
MFCTSGLPELSMMFCYWQCFQNWAWMMVCANLGVQCFANSDASRIEREWWCFVKNWVWRFGNLVLNFSA